MYGSVQDATSMASVRFLENPNSVLKTGICGPCGCAFISQTNKNQPIQAAAQAKYAARQQQL